ncbi:unnamed protein product [Haemonchus placei]|uniref:Transposase n=1 Tax=Haemonchus placei TaxID=6290 RepID=A0A0N4WB26_HAEPC|nr:unnamed protein product [Haemonchus placei]
MDRSSSYVQRGRWATAPLSSLVVHKLGSSFVVTTVFLPSALETLVDFIESVLRQLLIIGTTLGVDDPPGY